MRYYVVGLMFRRNFSEVALIHKQKPEWQKGLMNGVGGKVEPGEDPLNAMVREFSEETGYLQDQWNEFAETFWDEGYVKYYTCKNDDANLITTTVEEVDWVNVEDLHKLPLVPNLRWIIPMALAFYNEQFHASVDYSRDPAAKQLDPDQRQIRPNCPVCGYDYAMVLHGKDWVCHRTHEIDTPTKAV